LDDEEEFYSNRKKVTIFWPYMKARKLFKNKNYKLERFHLFPLLRKEDYNLSLSERERERERESEL